jgi:hypothetical protein
LNISSRRQLIRSDPPGWGLDVELSTVTINDRHVTKCHKGHVLERIFGVTQEIEIRHEIEIWNVRNIFRSASLKRVANELARYNFDLVAVQEVKLGKGGSKPADDEWECYTSYRNRLFIT